MFTVYRKDRPGVRGGGVIVAIRNNVSSSVISLNSTLEILWVTIKLEFQTCVVGVCYRPPNSPADFVEGLTEVIDEIQCRFPNCPLILAGDFNYPGIDWGACVVPDECAKKSECRKLLDMANYFNMKQIITAPTRGDAVLDLVFTTHPEHASVQVIDQISDHHAIHCDFSLVVNKRDSTRKEIFDYKRVDSETLDSMLREFSSTFISEFDERSVNENWVLFREKLLEVQSICVPTLKIAPSLHKPWFTTTIKRSIQKKKRLYRRALHLDSEHAWTVYHTYSIICKKEIKNAKQIFYDEDVSNMLRTDAKKFWKVINPKPSPVLPSVSCDDGSFLGPRQLAAGFNTFFSSVFTEEDDFPQPVALPSHAECIMQDIVITSHGVECAIDRLNANSSPGPDGISTKLLKLTKYVSGVLLARLFQQSLSSGEIPDDWKLAHVIPIFKSGDKNSFNNYRPISLTCVACKLMEHILSSQIMTHLSSNNLIFPNQHGFQREHSCETQLFEIIHDLHVSVHSLRPVDAVFIDFAKAFDRVPHNRLIYKLGTININELVIEWIASFLSNRSQSVVINKHVSSPIPVKSGVPQGSVLGPVLFLLYINDLPANIQSTIRLFADDCVIYRPISTPLDVCVLQRDLEIISQWCITWLMQINITKTKSVTFTTKLNVDRHAYAIGENQIEKVTSIKYLGVHLSSNLSWNLHTEHIISKASKTLGFLKRSLFQANKATKLLAYTSLVRSQLEYASIIWHPHQMYLTNNIESLQNKAARFIAKDYSRYSSVTNIKHSLNLSPLHCRRYISRMSFFHKLYHGSSAFRDLYIQPPHHVSSRVDHPFKVRPIFARTNLFKNSPLLLAVSDWNSLPSDIVSITSAQMFTNALTNV